MKYQITKRSYHGMKIYNVLIENDKELAEHILACFEYSNEEIIAVIRLK